MTFSLPDPAGELAGVRLVQDVRIPGDQLGFRYDDGHWRLVIDQPPVNRMEYQFELFRADGASQWVLDPGNPMTVDGAFGKKSVLEFDGYTPPAWLTQPAEPSDTFDLDLPASTLDPPGGSGPSGARGCPPAGAVSPRADTVISVRVWSPAGTPGDEPLPLLIAHDGPEYDSLASLTRYLAAGVTSGRLPKLRAALLSPGARDRWYSANLGYARALRHVVIPALTGRLATKTRIGMGASLGALAMLHAHCRFPDAFDALFLQSGSFFVPLGSEGRAVSSHERRFPYYRRIVRFVSGVHRSRLPRRPIPVELTCGVIEENVENNRLMTRTLRANGYPASLHEVPDMHNYTAWRDSFCPYLTKLIWQAGQ